MNREYIAASWSIDWNGSHIQVSVQQLTRVMWIDELWGIVISIFYCQDHCGILEGVVYYKTEHCLFLITHINIFVPVEYWNMVCWNIFNPLPKGVCWFAACRFVLLASSRTPTTMMYWPLASLSMLPLTRSWHAFPTTATSNRPKWGKNNQNLSCFNFTFFLKCNF